jgi:short-subunit dehydrogenase
MFPDGSVPDLRTTTSAVAPTHAFLPLLRCSRGAVVNNLSLAALSALPIMPGYSISKAAAFSATQSLRALLTSEASRCTPSSSVPSTPT